MPRLYAITPLFDAREGKADVSMSRTEEELLDEIKRLREALRQYAIHENWACWKTQQRNVWERDYEHGYKLAEDALGEGRQWPATAAA